MGINTKGPADASEILVGLDGVTSISTEPYDIQCGLARRKIEKQLGVTGSVDISDAALDLTSAEPSPVTVQHSTMDDSPSSVEK